MELKIHTVLRGVPVEPEVSGVKKPSDLLLLFWLRFIPAVGSLLRCRGVTPTPLG